MTTNNEPTLPTLDDFTESSVLDHIVPEEPEDPDKDPIEDPVEKGAEVKPSKKAKTKSPVEEPPLEEEEEDPEDPEEPEDPENPDDPEDPENEDQETFWEDVEKLTGMEVEVDYGDVDPETPEGAALRENALVEQVQQGVYAYIQQNHPKVFKALELEANGGNIAEIITPDYVDYSKIEVAEDNEAQQKKILLDYYIEVKNLSEKKAQRMVEADEDSEEEDGLFTAAKEALEERKQIQEQREEAAVTKRKKEAEALRKRDAQIVNYVNNVVNEGVIGNFNLPKPEREKFNEFFVKSVQRTPEGGYMFAVNLTNENFEATMEQAYFAFKGGKLDELVNRRAKTKSAQATKRRLKRNDSKAPTSSAAPKSPKKVKLPTMDIYSDE